jgi:hypothetical protein
LSTSCSSAFRERSLQHEAGTRRDGRPFLVGKGWPSFPATGNEWTIEETPAAVPVNGLVHLYAEAERREAIAKEALTRRCVLELVKEQREELDTDRSWAGLVHPLSLLGIGQAALG